MRFPVWIGGLAALSLFGQQQPPRQQQQPGPLTLRDAVRIALDQHPAVEAAQSRTRAAGFRIDAARSGSLPKVNYQESWARSDNPVFVFGSLLGQHQFTAANFDVYKLNRPDFLNNFQSLVTVDQNVWDWGATKALVRSAELGQRISQEQERSTRLDLMSRVVRAYYGAVLADASLAVAREAVKSADADAQRAEDVRRAGMSTDADLLSIQVHLAAVREQEIRRSYDARIARAALNEALGLALDTPHQLTTALQRAPLPADSAAGYESAAAQNRPELKSAELARSIAEQQREAARAALRPQVGLRGAFEANRQQFVRKGAANWLVAGSVRWNLFNGYADRARLAEAEASMKTAQAQQREAAQGVRLQVYQSWANARAAEERLSVAAAAVAQAEESLRIVKNRYDAGLATVTDLLRNETALLEARTRRLAALHDQRLAAAQLEFAAGTLSPESEILQ
jgi:outer membrane protein TolC